MSMQAVLLYIKRRLTDDELANGFQARVAFSEEVGHLAPEGIFKIDSSDHDLNLLYLRKDEDAHDGTYIINLDKVTSIGSEVLARPFSKKSMLDM